MDSLKCQTSTVTPAEPGDFPILVNMMVCPDANAMKVASSARWSLE